MLLTMQQQEALVSQKLATKKVCGDYVTYKYAKRVMYDYLWDKHPELLECRGHTYNIHTGELVLCPPKKSFNYLENGTWEGIPLDTPVIAFHKYNGFMASARIVNDELLVATTGTTNPETSQYVGWAKREIEKLDWRYAPVEGNTSVYEIVIPEDPHIVDDMHFRAVKLLTRWDDDGFYSINTLGWQVTLGEVLEKAKVARHEGWMVYDAQEYWDGNPIPSTCKIKTDYYVGKKKLMRMTDSKIEQMFANPVRYMQTNLPQSWDWFADTVVDYLSEDTWKSLGEQERRKMIEELGG